MILISDQDYIKAQETALNTGFGDFIKRLDNNELDSNDFNEPKAYISELLKFSLIGYQNYGNLYDYLNNIILDNKKIKFFRKPHTKQEVRDFLKNN